jgi:hypothetical protein
MSCRHVHGYCEHLKSLCCSYYLFILNLISMTCVRVHLVTVRTCLPVLAVRLCIRGQYSLLPRIVCLEVECLLISLLGVMEWGVEVSD